MVLIRQIAHKFTLFIVNPVNFCCSYIQSPVKWSFPKLESWLCFLLSSKCQSSAAHRSTWHRTSTTRWLWTIQVKRYIWITDLLKRTGKVSLGWSKIIMAHLYQYTLNCMLACLCNDFLKSPWMDFAELLTHDYLHIKGGNWVPFRKCTLRISQSYAWYLNRKLLNK